MLHSPLWQRLGIAVWRMLLITLFLSLSILILPSTTFAKTSPSAPKTFVSFSAFLTSVSNARYHDYASQSSGKAVQSEQAFAEMRSYILHMYAGVKQVSSFVLDGQYFDCITVNSQPTVHYLNIKQIAKPPQVNTQTTSGKGSTFGSTRTSNSPLTLGQKDEFGNPIACKDGTIPMERITMERLTRFPTLHDFLAKEPGGRGTHSPAVQSCDNPHCYAHAYQSVTNYGGNSLLNLWNPSGDFSLSQQWYAGGTGNNTQTAEGGWVHYPDHFSTQLSVLFIYYTADDYKTTGCYNLDCTAFVQINNNWTLGGPFSNYSSYGGDQYGFTLQYKYYQGNWWLFLKGSGDYEAVGYYPGSIYNNGQLASNAQEVDYGGETSTSGSDLPQMGSGKFASEGWQQAAFQNTIFYIPRDENGGTGEWTTLSPNQTNPNCYTITVTPYTNGGDWGTYFYFGGPGGQC